MQSVGSDRVIRKLSFIKEKVARVYIKLPMEKQMILSLFLQPPNGANYTAPNF